jgi:hypothetical protein
LVSVAGHVKVELVLVCCLILVHKERFQESWVEGQACRRCDEEAVVDLALRNVAWLGDIILAE